MKGLMIKDLRIILAQKRYMLMVGAIGVFMALTQENMSFGLMYMMMIATIMAVSTLSYDSYEENGLAYLMMLPIQRSTYVLEKYLFVSGMIAVVGVVFSGVGILYEFATTGSVNWTDTFASLLIAVIMGCVLMSLMLPTNLKYGAEKSRVVMLVFGGSILGIVYCLKSVLEKHPELMVKLYKLEEIPGWIFGVAGGVIFVLVVSVSFIISVNVLRKKEF